MARVSGPGIQKNGSYEAKELVGRGMYLLVLKEVSDAETVLNDFINVKISQETARKIGRHKLPGESLALAVERLALASLHKKSAVK